MDAVRGATIEGQKRELRWPALGCPSSASPLSVSRACVLSRVYLCRVAGGHLVPRPMRSTRVVACRSRDAACVSVGFC